jgi:hypothetical protein
MKLATKMTLATSLVVTLASAGFAWYETRSQSQEYQLSAQNEALRLAKAVVATLQDGSDWQHAASQPIPIISDALKRAAQPWQLSLTTPAMLRSFAPAFSLQLRSLLRRAQAVIELPSLELNDSDNYSTFATVALQWTSPSGTTTTVAALEAYRPQEQLRQLTAAAACRILG